MSSIWYRFYCEKNWFEFSFPNKVIKIGDIQKEIIKRKNMSKAPEEFVFHFYDEENNLLKEDYPVEPMKRLIIKRFPLYKFKDDFVPIVKDPREILKKTTERGELQQTIRYYEPLEKIANKLSLEMINKIFKCKLCIKTDIETLTNYNPIITFCCKETICLDCYNKNENNICPFCNKQKKGYVPNLSEKNLRIKLLDILEKKRIEKEKTAKMLAAAAEITPIKDPKNYMNSNNSYNQYNKNNNIINDNKNNLNNGINYSSIKQRNIINNNTMIDGNNISGGNNNLVDDNNIYNNNTGNIINNNQFSDNKTKDQNNNIQNNVLQNPCLPLIQDARFFIIKSSNKENIEKSQKNSVWATTIPNQKKLNEAFSKNKVILIFSANGTQSYQGYGIMTSYSSDRPSNIWQIETPIKLGGDFTVNWLCFCSLSFSKVKNLQNPKNNGDPVIKSRDCTELSPEIGMQLCKYCYEQEKYELNNSNNNNQQNKITSQLIEKINEDIKNNRNKQQQKKTLPVNNINNANNVNNINNNVSNNQTNNVNFEKNETQNLNNIPVQNVASTQPMMQYCFPFPYYWKMMPMMTTDQSQQQTQMVNEQGIPMMTNNMMYNNVMMNNQMNNQINKESNNKDNKDKKDKDKKEHKKSHHHSDYHRKNDDRKRKRSRSRKEKRKSRSRDKSRRY